MISVDPIDGIKGKTWGPSTMQKERFRPSASILGNDRCCKSAPNIQKTLCHFGGHSNIGALQELGKYQSKCGSILLVIYVHLFYFTCIFSQSLSQSINLFVQKCNRHWTGHQGRMQPPLTGAHKNSVSKSNK